MRTALMLALTVATATAGAQSAPTPEASDRAKDAAEVLGVVNRLWEAMRTNDSVMARSVFDSTAKLARVLDWNGTRSVRWDGPDGFIRAVGSAKEPWIERMVGPEVRIDGNLASVWTWYDFSVGGKVSHCGYDSIELARMNSGWKIIYLADTRWTAGCDKPPASR